MPKHKIAFLTSGGDSPGMNAAIRAIVRMSIYQECTPFAIIGGYQGLVDGGECIVEYSWDQVAYILAEGGTVIRSSRCAEFRERAGRLKAARNLVKLGINKLIVIGGDGSLSGADTFRFEWESLLEELLRADEVNKEEVFVCQNLMVVGLVGSIDNDMYGTEMTIGANSSLHRIIEAVDNISSTASSHSRAFIIEVMGRNCGWLAVNACLAIGADYLFIPEDPPEDGWEERMKATVKRRWENRKGAGTMVILCEGAVDRQNNLIKSEHVKLVLESCGLDARVTTLGHIQRGGPPSAFDRYMATLQGVEAVKALLDATEETPSIMIGIKENKIIRLPLMECVKKTRLVDQMLREGKHKEAYDLRGPDFKANYGILRSFYRLEEAQALGLNSHGARLRIAFINCGAPCCGINAANRAIILYCLFKGYTPVGIFNGFSGMIQGDLRELSLKDGPFHGDKGGSCLGMNRSLPTEDMGLVAYYLQKYQIDGLIIIGGFESFTAQLALTEARKEYPALDIPIVCLPSTVSNNVPGTDYSVGCDTALNIILQSADNLKQSASSSRKRAFVIDVQGGNCGFLASMGALASGASSSYIPEEGIRLGTLVQDAKHLRRRFSEDKMQGRLILRNEKSSPIYTAELISKILESESEGLFDARWASLGHLQQGGNPSPLDRIRATRLAVLCIAFIESVLKGQPSVLHSLFNEPYQTSLSNGNGTSLEESLPLISPVCNDSPRKTTDDSTSVIIGIKGPWVVFSCAKQVKEEADMALRRPIDQWWLPIRSLAKILAKYNNVK